MNPFLLSEGLTLTWLGSMTLTSLKLRPTGLAHTNMVVFDGLGLAFLVKARIESSRTILRSNCSADAAVTIN